MSVCHVCVGAFTGYGLVDLIVSQLSGSWGPFLTSFHGCAAQVGGQEVVSQYAWCSTCFQAGTGLR